MSNGKSVGPVDGAQFQQLAATGVILPDSLVWREGMAEWKKYAEIAQTISSTAAASADGAGSEARAVCDQCHGSFSPGELITYSGRRLCPNCKTVFFQKLKEGGEAEAMSNLRYAGFWIRFAAYFIDGIAMNLVTQPLAALAGVGMFSHAALFGKPQRPEDIFTPLYFVMMAVMMMIPLVYNTWMNGRFGATLGKMAVGLKIVRSDGSRLSYGRAFGRAWAWILSAMTCYIGFIMAGVDNPEKRALHDRICDTRVVYKKQ